MKHPTHEALRRLRLYGMARGLEDLERQPERNQLSFDDQLALLVELGIHHFNRTLQSCGSGRQDCINLTMRRIPRVNQEVLLRATFLGWSAGLFFRLGLGDERRPTGPWTPPRRGPGT